MSALLRADVTREELLALPTPDLDALLARAEWQQRRHPHQQLPSGDDWRIHLMKAGRGSGKTRWASEEVWWLGYQNAKARILVAAPTSDDLRSTVFEGESGLLSVIPQKLLKNYNRSLHEIVLINDSLIRGIPASEPERFRGGNWGFVWADELCSWQYDREAFDMIMFALRIGQNPRMIITTTPKPRALIRDLMKRKDVCVTEASSYANIANLAPTFRDQLLRYEGSKLGDQEIHGKILDPEEQGIVKRSQIRMWPAKDQLPAFDYLVMSLDTAMTEQTRDKETGDPDFTACQVWGLFWHEKRANALMVDAWRERLGFPDLLTRVTEEMKAEYGISEEPIIRPLIGPARVNVTAKKIDLLIVERQGAGRQLLQVMSRQGVNGYEYNPGRMDKLTRLYAVSHLFSNGVVWMPEGRRFEKDTGRYLHTGEFASWAQPVVDQLVMFSGEGSIPHDDDMDAATQALRLLSDRNMLDQVRPKTAKDYAEEEADAAERYSREAPMGNPYAA